MALAIEDYALIGDAATAALVGKDGSIDWLCLPRFDSPTCFAALLGTPANGRWLLAPAGEIRRVERTYRDGTLVLDTVFVSEDGEVVVTDFMPRSASGARSHEDRVDLVRVAHCRRGRVAMRSELVARFDYGSVVPWLVLGENCLSAVAGPDAIHLYGTVPMRTEEGRIIAEFALTEPSQVSFSLNWQPSHRPCSILTDTIRALVDTETKWRHWSGRCRCDGPWRTEVMASLITLKALTHSTTGAIVAAPTTSLPEELGGIRNWDYRYCWLRDATFSLTALLKSGYVDEARAWRQWLMRAVAGEASQSQIVYGIAGERRITETELGWLPGYQGSRPVRVGNAASTQVQLDVFGEVMAVLHAARRLGLEPVPEIWNLQRAFIDTLEGCWRSPDEGLWEVRGEPRQFVHSKVMVWVALDRAIKDAERFQFPAPLERWRALRAEVHAEVCAQGWDEQRGSFVQFYGAKGVDAALLLIPVAGFLPSDDPRVAGTIRAVERELLSNGLVYRYRSERAVDGLPPGEGAFVACTFWYVDALVLAGRRDEAREVFERLLALRNDVGLLAEEYDPVGRRHLGNFPQAFSHVALINSAHRLGPAPPT